MTEDYMKYAKQVTPKRVIKWYLIGAAALVAVGIGAFALRVLMAPVAIASNALTQAGRVINKTIDADNVLHNYEWFFDTSTQIKARVQQIGVHSELFRTEKEPSERSRLRIEMVAMQQSCRDMAAKYNANAAKANRSIFRSNDTPESIEVSTCEVKL